MTISSSSLFKMMDTSVSGSLTLKEFTAGRALASSSLRQAISSTSAKEVFNGMDTDANGSLSKTELAQGLAELSQSTTNALLAAQEKQSPTTQLSNSLKVQAYSTLQSLLNGTTQTGLGEGQTTYHLLKTYYGL